MAGVAGRRYKSLRNISIDTSIRSFFSRVSWMAALPPRKKNVVLPTSDDNI